MGAIHLQESARSGTDPEVGNEEQRAGGGALTDDGTNAEQHREPERVERPRGDFPHSGRRPRRRTQWRRLRCVNNPRYLTAQSLCILQPPSLLYVCVHVGKRLQQQRLMSFFLVDTDCFGTLISVCGPSESIFTGSSPESGVFACSGVVVLVP